MAGRIEMMDSSIPRDLDDTVAALGQRIRARRQALGMTLTQTAAIAGLSHSFLSQVERGLERLSMSSLFRVAEALDTTQQALLVDGARSERGGRHHMFSAGESSAVDVGDGRVTVLAKGSPPFVPMIHAGSFTAGDWWVHDEEEFVQVLDGSIVIELDDESYVLQAGDSCYYEGGVRHRWHTPEGVSARLLVVKEAQRH